ncbi:MAG TPA: DUF1269 domain-containing protein [Ktedonobacteraceae bacterium]|nr:DUF1269 domain-containing protein [Ktedonobacteraceae bacterium]
MAAMPSRGSCLTWTFWGLLFGLLFFIPFLGLAMGALMGHFARYGIDEGFIDQLRATGHVAMAMGASPGRPGVARPGPSLVMCVFAASLEGAHRLRAMY